MSLNEGDNYDRAAAALTAAKELADAVDAIDWAPMMSNPDPSAAEKRRASVAVVRDAVAAFRAAGG